MNKLSVVIPTLQRNKDFLINLIKSVANEDIVDEIILIDNSTKGFELACDKLRVIVPKENMYVNPSWNLGIHQAKNEIVALLNDDIIIPSKFCTNVVEKMSTEMGVVGADVDNIITCTEMLLPPDNADLELKKVNGRCMHFGIAMFLYKSNFVDIPNDLKIYCGDDWIVLQAMKSKKGIYNICGQTIYHYGSLSCGEKKFNPIGDRDRKLYRKITRKWWQFIFNYEPVFRGFRITVLGIELLHHFSRKH